jgi:peptidyl-prolyl isomerase D
MWLRRCFATLPKVFLDISIEGCRSLVAELRTIIVPKTAENFLKLCVGENGETEVGQEITFKGRSFTELSQDYGSRRRLH